VSPAPLAQQLVGAWSLTAYEALGTDGSVEHPMGRRPEGLLAYTPDGLMSVQIMSADRRRWGRPATDSDRADAAAGYLAYAGRYEVDEDAATVVHHVEMSLVPNWVGTAQRRSIALSGDRLQLTATPTVIDGVRRTPRLSWSRRL
jgi:hypothetical protein